MEKSFCVIIYYAIIVLFIVITIMASYCCALLLYPNVKLVDYVSYITAIVAVFAFIVAWMEYLSRKNSMQAQVFSEYNICYSEDPNIVKVVKYLNDIDANGADYKSLLKKPSNYEVEMFMRFFEELEVQICCGRLNEKDVIDIFIYYARKTNDNQDLRNHLGVSDFEENWSMYKSLMKRVNKYK